MSQRQNIEELFSVAYAKARDWIKPYPEREEDLQRALSEARRGLTAVDAAVLLRLQNSFCEKCGECCRRNTPINVHRAEAESIAAYLGMSYKKLKKWLGLVPKGDGTFDMPAAPCKLLVGNRCRVYPVRPMVCKVYPAGFILVQIGEGAKAIELPSYCGAIATFLAFKLACMAINYRLEREEPALFSVIVEENKRLLIGVNWKDGREAVAASLRLVERWMEASRFASLP